MLVKVAGGGVERAHLAAEGLHVLLKRGDTGGQLVLYLGQLRRGLAQQGKVSLLLGQAAETGGKRVQIFHGLGHQARGQREHIEHAECLPRLEIAKLHGVKLVLWDIDGTLVHTAGHGRDAFAEAFAAVFGREADIDEVDMAGRTDHMIAMAVLEGGGVSDGETHMERMFEELARALEARRERIAAEGHAMPGVREALGALAGREGVTQSLLTGNIEANAALKLAAFGLDSLVDLEIGGYGSDPHEARSDLVAVAREKAVRLRDVHVEAGETVLIGDTPLDVRAAHEAGARAVAVATGPYTAAELREAGADGVLEDVTSMEMLISHVGV